MLGRVIFACPLCRDTADLHASVESFVDDTDSDSDEEEQQAHLRRVLADTAIATQRSSPEPRQQNRPTFNDGGIADTLSGAAGEVSSHHQTGRRTLVNPDLHADSNEPPQPDPSSSQNNPDQPASESTSSSSQSSIPLSPNLAPQEQEQHQPPTTTTGGEAISLVSPTFSEQATTPFNGTRPPSQHDQE